MKYFFPEDTALLTQYLKKARYILNIKHEQNMVNQAINKLDETRKEYKSDLYSSEGQALLFKYVESLAKEILNSSHNKIISNFLGRPDDISYCTFEQALDNKTFKPLITEANKEQMLEFKKKVNRAKRQSEKLSLLTLTQLLNMILAPELTASTIRLAKEIFVEYHRLVVMEFRKEKNIIAHEFRTTTQLNYIDDKLKKKYLIDTTSKAFETSKAVQLGEKLLYMALEHTHLFEVQDRPHKHAKICYIPNESCLKELEQLKKVAYQYVRQPRPVFYIDARYELPRKKGA